MKKHPGADVLVNFASLRSAYDSTMDAMNYPQVWTVFSPIFSWYLSSSITLVAFVGNVISTSFSDGMQQNSKAGMVYCYFIQIKDKVIFSMISCLFQIRTIAIIAEGIPENLTRKLIQTSEEKDVSIIGPATVSLLFQIICETVHHSNFFFWT